MEVGRDYSEAVTAAPSDLQRLAGLLSATGPAMELRSPLTGTRIGSCPSTEADVTAAADRPGRPDRWAARPVEERADLLLAFHDAVLDRRDALVNLVQSGVSRPGSAPPRRCCTSR